MVGVQDGGWGRGDTDEGWGHGLGAEVAQMGHSTIDGEWDGGHRLG